ncbi:hypothetical protein RN607_00160 [Demequina capsici]|uniref:Uncharacterized protein n=1 Tax=Demequina capsici TaxID=3075620 RepID=A0AA96JAK4_9MICO|nr:hypothetical protein [Demequina sp. PMTSA13]WNM27450.1 hypothetical protein RN607_00160 [Demequina sp. PMTSA13]
MVVFNDTFLDGDSVTVGLYDVDHGEYPDFGATPTESLNLPGASQEVTPGAARIALAMVSPQTAAIIGWPHQPTTVLVDEPESITDQQVAQLTAAARMPDGSTPYVYLGDGPNGDYLMVVYAGVIGVALLLVVASVSIALGLARADARQDDFTLASLGASPQLARSVAAWVFTKVPKAMHYRLAA